jgi:pilus assembly protein Flp/PilA
MSKLGNVLGRREESGASAVEYGLLVAGIAGLIVAVVFVFGGAVRTSFSRSCGRVSAGASASSTSSCG